MVVGIRDSGTDGIICSGDDCAMIVATEGILAGPEAGVDVVGVEMTSVADGEETTLPPWGPSPFFFGLSSHLSLIFERRCFISLSDEVNIRHFCGSDRAAEQVLLLPDALRPIVSHSRRRPHLVNRRDSTVAGFMHGEKMQIQSLENSCRHSPASKLNAAYIVTMTSSMLCRPLAS